MFMKLVGVLGASVAAWVLLALAKPAHADCMTSCMAGKGCGLQYESSRIQPGYCSIARGDCEVQCRRDEEARATYGAIALSPSTGVWGEAYQYGGRAEAERRALGECGKRERDCVVAVWFKDQCGAVARAADGRWAFGLGPTPAAAGKDALTDCRKSGAKSCEALHAVCSR